MSQQSLQIKEVEGATNVILQPMNKRDVRESLNLVPVLLHDISDVIVDLLFCHSDLTTLLRCHTPIVSPVSS
ncbi:hypothetical protein AVEN_192188-1 [Araneus ventricosus]|uniref:Uncharacterized protein n=1 Tax=Araneus ventricosus TaxID=182803 RepID=A0A4Y2J3K4_ARAVE|nr:hypothetical protein AVEN_192188-1 [Araneus ventricosus]